MNYFALLRPQNILAMRPMTVVIPCYNEGARIVLDDFRAFLATEPIHVTFVNDGSTDNTLELLRGLQSEFPLCVKVLSLARNSGKAEAVRQGMLWAAYSAGTDIVGFMDADLSTPLEEMSTFDGVFARRNVDMVFGSRIMRIGSQIHRFHYRHYFGRTMATLISIYLRIPIYDSQCGAKFFHKELAREIFQDPFVTRWLFDVELFRRIQQSGRDVEACCWELPLDTWVEKGDSKLGMRDLLGIPLDFWKIVRHYRKTLVGVRVEAPVLSDVFIES
jgi:glycosyltransferase involved in cell wall biosynthesis